MPTVPNPNLLTLPANVGRAIVETGAVFARPLLGIYNFVSFCKARNISIDRQRLFRLERLGVFSPVFRVRSSADSAQPFHLPVRSQNNWFEAKLAWDTTAAGTYQIPDETDPDHEAYYSVFQIDDLLHTLSQLTLTMHLDNYLDAPSSNPAQQFKPVYDWIATLGGHLKTIRGPDYRHSIAMLCQFVSERYYPLARGDQRTIQISQSTYSDHWISAHPPDRNWRRFAREWDPGQAESLFDLTPQKLRHAYETLALAQANIDPLEHWHPLVQFVSVKERDKLKSDALCAENIREGAHVLRFLYKDLYKNELPLPNMVFGATITNFPELSVRNDTRRHLEFVANRFGVNPQPRLTIFVEGPSEEHAITKLFLEYFGLHPGKLGVEIVVLWGVDVATGTKEDNFRAIIRLIDYLHHHQTITFVILDNENHAKKLQTAARRAKSIHHTKRFVTRPEYIRVWRTSFEFDNFSCSEIATAMSIQGKVRFLQREISTCKKEPAPGAKLTKLYEQKTGHGLNKIRLAETLVENMLKTKARKISTRPIVKTLERIERLAALNHLPTQKKIWDRNQASRYLGMKRP